MARRKLHPDTVAIRSGRPGGPNQPLNAPIVPASNFSAGPGNAPPQAKDFSKWPIAGPRVYSRDDGTESVNAFEAAIGELEGGWSVAFSSGMAAVSAIFSELRRGAIVVAPEDCYHGVVELLKEGQQRSGWQIKTVKTDDTARWIELLGIGPDLVWLESPSNPLLQVGDIPAICAAAESEDIVCAVDNTFATPLLQRPLDLGATYSIHSATKFIGGHSDLLGGVASTADPTVLERLARRRTLGGATMGALEAFLALRGLRTLPVRLTKSQATAVELARRLARHPAVTAVRFPGLPGTPAYELAKRTMSGPGAVLSFDTIGTATQLDKLLNELEVIHVATSLGAVETTLERRARLASQQHLPPTLVRLSVGCEHAEDLWADLAHVLNRLKPVEPNS